MFRVGLQPTGIVVVGQVLFRVFRLVQRNSPLGLGPFPLGERAVLDGGNWLRQRFLLGWFQLFRGRGLVLEFF